jgi:membrane-associated phospholipid phosphatase
MFTNLWSRAGNRTARPPTNRVRTKSVRRLCFEPLEDRCLLSGDVVLQWNQLALDAIRQVKPNPVAASRSLAIEQVAVFDAVNAIDRSFTSYFAQVHASHGASLVAAAAQAGHDTLTAMFPTLKSTFDAALAADLVGIPPGLARQGSDVGQDVAQQILALRSNDGSTAVVTYVAGTNPGDWQPTPPAFSAPLAPQWGSVTPWAMTSQSQFRPPPPPALSSLDYAIAFNEVKSLGRSDSTTRTGDQTQIASFWKDAAGTSYAFGHWNEIAAAVSIQEGLGLVQNARLFALLNIATADALIDTWEAKFDYSFWRPITAIQYTGDDSLNPATQSDPTWTPLIVTPNFPSYQSAHSTVSSAMAAILTAEFGQQYHFSIGSDGLAGVTRSFASFDGAAAEAGQSRIYGGIHFQFDNQAGLASGQALGQFVYQQFLRPIEEGDSRHPDHTGGQNNFGAPGLALLLAGPSNAAPASRGGFDGQQDNALTTGQRIPPTEVEAANSVDKDQPIQQALAGDRLVAQTLDHRVLDQVLADLADSMYTDPLQRDGGLHLGQSRSK